MTSQTLTNWTIRDVMKTRSRRTFSYFRNSGNEKQGLKKAGKVCFAENLQTIHEVPYKYDIYNTSNLRLKLPEIEVHKYTPLVCRDPYARPSKRTLRDKLADMFVSDTFKLPFIKEDRVAKKITPTKSKDESLKTLDDIRQNAEKYKTERKNRIENLLAKNTFLESDNDSLVLALKKISRN